MSEIKEESGIETPPQAEGQGSAQPARAEVERVDVYDSEGSWFGWFDENTAEVYNEDTYFDGRNMISRATGDEFVHEALHRTASGKNLLHHWSDWQGTRDWWKVLDDDDAAEWLAKNKYEYAENDDLDRALQELVGDKEL